MSAEKGLPPTGCKTLWWNFSQKPLSPQLSWGDVHCCCGNCWLPLPHRSITIINLTPATRTTVDDVVQR